MNKNIIRRNIRLFAVGILGASIWVTVANAKPGLEGVSQGDEAYWKVATQRAQKIVDKMDIDPVEKAGRVRDIIATQYQSLHTLHENRDAAIAALGDDAPTDAAKAKAQIESLRRDADLEVTKRHYHFIAQLASELEPAQIDKVKDGMTYGVVPLTYRRYRELLPDLDEEHLRYIYAALVEAREYAMDEGSSEEKHRRFGKYKGRINNYLSALGIDMKAAERALVEREKIARK